MSATTVIAVTPSQTLTTRRRLFSALEALLPLRFSSLAHAVSPAAIVEAGRARSGDDPGHEREDIPKIVFDERGASGPVSDVLLLEDASLDRRLRDTVLGGQQPARAIEVGDRDKVLARDSAGARWTASNTGHAPAHRVALELPELRPGEVLRDALMSDRSLAVAALVQFLREVCGESRFAAPPLRAAVIFDDPNLRWRSYGFIDYRRLVAHADAHSYHASMAMVPLDASGAHGPTGALFRERADRLSLSFHGNNHVKRELLGPADRATAVMMCAQALRRVERFEARTGLGVDRVMVPPHGLYSESVAWALAALGFDALCAIHTEPGVQSPATDDYLAGWGPASFSGPTAVIPRFPLTSSQTEIALRAFMDNPLILYGHHEDVASGLDLLAQAAGRVNALGDVRWCSLDALARDNARFRVRGDNLELEPYSGRVRVSIPKGVNRLTVREPRDARGTLTGWSMSERRMSFNVPVDIGGAAGLQVRLRTAGELPLDAVPAPRRHPMAKLRRATTEARDRVRPLGVAPRVRTEK